jgi:hypothetical protein
LAVEGGQELLHYRLIEKIGEGGMGVVWKAVDTALDRHVAIKVLPEAVAADAERLARLEREAKLAASLNHPNIATVHGLHQAGPVRFVAMELVEGENLAARLSRGPLPSEEGLRIATQIAEGLEAAHASGVIHRDLKPANIQLTTDGRVKVLDFGLARAFEANPGSREIPPTMSPTLTSAGTVAGAILGTAAYMSPEQARGQVVDNRADVWAFGVVLFEIIGGRSPFKGDTASDTLASVLKLEPDYESLAATVPNRILRLVKRCLQKDARKRLHHIADARIVLEETLAGVPDEQASGIDAAPPNRTGERLLWLTALVLVAAVAGAAAWFARPAGPDRPHRKFHVVLDGRDPDTPDDQNVAGVEISPDGTRLLYRSGERVFVRDLDAWESREIPAAAGANRRFWSHDGRSIGFIKERKLSRASVDGSHVEVIAELPASINGAAWGPNGTIMLAGTFNDRTGLFEVSERGGEVKERMILGEREGHFHNFDILPDGRSVLITVHRGTAKVLSLLTGGTLTPLVEVESRYLPDPRYSTSGHMLYARGGNNPGIWALPFSADTLEVGGEPFLVAAGGNNFSVSRDGTMIYRDADYDPPQRLVWVDREGTEFGTIGQPRIGFDTPAISPDGGRIVVAAGFEFDSDLWLIDVARGTMTVLARDDGAQYEPAWSVDGTRVVYRHRPPGSEDTTIRIANADGRGEPETLVDGTSFSLAPSGALVFSRIGEETKSDLWLLEPGAVATEAKPLIQTAADEARGRVSPDGSTIAYQSSESDDTQVYLKRFPSGEGRWQVSLDGGRTPRWSPKGDELYWVDGEGLMVTEVQTLPEITLGTPRRLFTWNGELWHREYDVAADAGRFVMVTRAEEPDESDSTADTVLVVENWAGE